MSQSIIPEATETTSLLEVEDEDIQFPPCDLYSDEPPLETDLHRNQIESQLDRKFSHKIMKMSVESDRSAR